jgi:hypothetical protein
MNPPPFFKSPTAWDVGAYALGLWCLGHNAGLF